MSTITKKEMIDRIAEKTNTKRLVVKPVIQSFLDEIIRELAKDNRLEFRDFGVFEPRLAQPGGRGIPKRCKRLASRPRVVKFKVGRLMKQRVSPPEPQEHC